LFPIVIKMVLIAHSQLLIGATLNFAGETLPKPSSKRKVQTGESRTERSGPARAHPAFDGHGHPESGPQRDERPRVDPMPGLEMEAVQLRERGDAQLRFDESELIADAPPRAGAERDKCKLRPIGASLR